MIVTSRWGLTCSTGLLSPQVETASARDLCWGAHMGIGSSSGMDSIHFAWNWTLMLWLLHYRLTHFYLPFSLQIVGCMPLLGLQLHNFTYIYIDPDLPSSFSINMQVWDILQRFYSGTLKLVLVKTWALDVLQIFSSCHQIWDAPGTIYATSPMETLVLHLNLAKPLSFLSQHLWHFTPPNWRPLFIDGRHFNIESTLPIKDDTTFYLKFELWYLQ